MRNRFTMTAIILFVLVLATTVPPLQRAWASGPVAGTPPGSTTALATARPPLSSPRSALQYRQWRDGQIPQSSQSTQSPYVTGAAQLKKLASTSTTGGAWNPLGPAPIDTSGIAYPKSCCAVTNAAGRVLSLAYAPSSGTIYLGSADGGVWKTTNGGTSWTPLSDSMPSLAIGALAVDPNNNNVIYAGTGEIASALDALYGVGIYKSVDGGSNWTLYGATVFHGQAISAIRVDPTNSNLVYAGVVNRVGGTTRGVALSTDGGQTWSEPTASTLSSSDVTDLVIDNAGNLYAAVAGDGVYVSSDHGSTWTRMSTGLPGAAGNQYKIALAPNTAGAALGSQTLYAVVGNATDGTLRGVYATTTAGTAAASWTQIGDATSLQDTGNQAWYDIYVAVDPTDTTGNTLYIGLTDLYKTTNALGANPTWTNISNVYGGICSTTRGTVHPDQHAALFVGGTVYFGNDGGVYSAPSSSLSGSSCQMLVQNSGFETGPPYTPWLESLSTGGSEIVNSQLPFSGVNSADLCGSVLPCSESISQTFILPTTFSKLVFRYYFNVQSQDTSATCPDVFTAVLHTSDNKDWGQASVNSCHPRGWYVHTADVTAALAPYKGQYVTVFFHGTGDATGQTHFFLDDVSLNAINGNTGTYTPNNGNLSLSQFYGGGVGTGANASSLVFGGLQDNGNVITTNSGSSWQEVKGGDGFYAAVDYNNNNNLYAEYANGATAYSNDQGGTWTEAAPSSTDASLFAAPLVMDPTTPSTLYAGQGHLWKTTDGMHTWANIGPDTGTSGISAIAVSNSNPNTIYIGDRSAHSYVTTDGGTTWTSMDGTGCTTDNQSPYQCTPSSSGITGLAVDPTNSQIVYATVNSFEGAQKYHVFKSINGGTNWTDISTTLPDLPFQSIAVNPVTPTTIYAGADMGVYVSTDAGVTWSVFGTGLANASIYSLVPSRDGTQLVAFTHGRGAWRIPASTVTTSPSVTLSLTSLTFNAQTVGTTSAARTITLTNTGTADLTMTAITASGDFAQTNTCGTSVAAAGSCTINVTFTPTAVGTRNGSITIQNNAPTSPQSVTLTGTGVASGPTTITINAGAGWNMVGGTPLTLWTDSTINWSFSASLGQWYHPTGTEAAGTGTWERVSTAGPRTVQVLNCGAPVSVPVVPYRWNLVGNPCSVPAALPAGTRAYWWDPKANGNTGAYTVVTSINPGAAAWVKPNSASIGLKPSSLPSLRENRHLPRPNHRGGKSPIMGSSLSPVRSPLARTRGT